uniref:Zinc knuckle CX2CX4HX4C domain-containing protein n=1 Tax=Cannabis sativa TaxID=3483 RepID=A0A803Q6P4_CANSA
MNSHSISTPGKSIYRRNTVGCYWANLLSHQAGKKSNSWLFEECLEYCQRNVSTVYELPKNIERNFERGSFGMGTVRFRATVDLSKPLFSGFFLRRPRLKDLWVQYKYERLPKMCFKCGILTHDKFCFKNLTVIKNGEGAFFPMYGVWMDEEAKESSPFQQPLPKWFNDWIVNKKALKDPKFGNQLKNQCIIQQAEASECRELRLQYPGKRRLAEEVVEERPESGEVVLNRYQVVLLPGIGEVTPFKNTATGVVEKVLPDPPSIEDVSSASQCMSKGDSTSMHVDGENGCMAHIVENDNGDKLDIAEGTKVSANIAYVGTKGPGDTSKTKRLSSGSPSRKISVSNEPKGSIANGENSLGLSSAHKEKAPIPDGAKLKGYPIVRREQLTNSLLGRSNTIDKYHREPTLFNPILDIDDFRCYEAEKGPRKRKSTYGFFMLPEERPLSTSTTPEDIPLPALDNEAHTTGQLNFLPGLDEGKKVKRNRGRPRKVSLLTENPGSDKRRRGRPVKSYEAIGVTQRSLKRRGSTAKYGGQYRNMWNTDLIDISIDLQNHFVVVDKKQQNGHRCVIQEIDDDGKAKHSDGNLTSEVLVGESSKVFQFGAVETCPEMLNLDKFALIANKLHFTEFTYIPPIGFFGGFGVCWKVEVKCNILDHDKNLIVGAIESNPPGKTWLLMGVYGPPTLHFKEVFWNGVGDYILKASQPILLLGDLNGTLEDHECINYTHQNNSARYSFDLMRMVAGTGVIDLGCQGGKFTWFQKSTNTQRSCTLKRARLDRAVATVDWTHFG